MTFNDNTKNCAEAGRALRNVLIALGCGVAIAAVVLVLVHNRPPSSKPGVDKEQPKETPTTLATGAKYDFGFLEPEATRETILAIVNPSSSPVRVINARTGCPCVKAAASKESFQPGEPLALRVAFIAPKKPVLYARRLYVETSDPKNRMLWVLIKADVGLPLVTEPAEPDLGTVALGKRTEAKITMVNRSTKPARLLYSTCSTPGCVLKAPLDAIPAGARVVLPVAVQPGSDGPNAATFDVATDVPGQESFRVTVKFAGAKLKPNP